MSDYCIVSAIDCPPDDLFLTVMLGLMSDEDTTLSVVNPRYNIFLPKLGRSGARDNSGVRRPRVPPYGLIAIKRKVNKTPSSFFICNLQRIACTLLDYTLHLYLSYGKQIPSVSERHAWTL